MRRRAAGGRGGTAQEQGDARERATPAPVKLILVGGFLGAGKTTLLSAATHRLERRGHVVGLVTNDQAPELVDTALLARDGTPVEEVAGSCFCCNYDGLLDAVAALREQGATAVIAEPVGSCTDLSATILQPTKARHRAITLAPLSVLIEPERLDELLNDQSILHRNARYIVDVQLQEADRIVLTKVDTLSPERRTAMRAMLAARYPAAEIMEVAAATGEGVDLWLENVIAGGTSGQRVVDVDYDRYAEGEAVLGWFNGSYRLKWRNGAPDWNAAARLLITDLHRELRRESAAVGHLKLMMVLADGAVTANLTTLDGDVSVRAEGARRSASAQLVLNARVQIAPEQLAALVDAAMQRLRLAHCTVTTEARASLAPSRPTPTHRYDRVVASSGRSPAADAARHTDAATAAGA